MRNSLKRCLAVVASVALFASLGFVYNSTAQAEEAARVTVIVICLGAPQEHSTVTIGDREEETKKNGACVFDIAPGTYTVSGSSKGLHGTHAGSKSVNFTVTGGEIRQVVLEVCQPEKWPQIFDYAGPSDEQR